jgi:flagellar M-ring protein FliF
VFEPLPVEELDELETLVRSAVGIDDARGDTLSIVSRRLAMPEPLAEVEEPFIALERLDWMRMAEIGGLVVAAFLILMLGVRPLLRRIDRPAVSADGSSGARLLTGPDGKHLLVRIPDGRTIKIDENGLPLLVGPNGEAMPDDRQGDHDRISLKHIEGDVNASVLDEMSDLIKDRPEDAIRVIRSWLHAS